MRRVLSLAALAGALLGLGGGLFAAAPAFADPYTAVLQITKTVNKTNLVANDTLVYTIAVDCSTDNCVGATLTDDSGNPMSREASIIDTIEHNAAVAGINPSDLRISIFPIGDDFSNPEGWEERQDAGAPGDYMRVRVRYDHPFLTPIVRHVSSDDHLAVMAEATYRNELFE